MIFEPLVDDFSGVAQSVGRVMSCECQPLVSRVERSWEKVALPAGFASGDSVAKYAIPLPSPAA